MDNDVINRVNDSRIDELEAAMVANLPLVDCPLLHRFTDKMYIREIFMPADTLVTSKIHKTNHPFVVSMGSVSVKIDDGEWELIEAPYSGTTLPGTRRVLYIHSDTIWTTFHVNEDNCHDIEMIENRILEPYTNTLLTNKEERRVLCHS